MFHVSFRVDVYCSPEFSLQYRRIDFAEAKAKARDYRRSLTSAEIKASRGVFRLLACTRHTHTHHVC